MYHFWEYFESTNTYTNTPLIQENTSHKKDTPTIWKHHETSITLQATKVFWFICLTSFSYLQQSQQYDLPVSYRSGMISGHASNMTEKSWSHLSKRLQTHMVNSISLLLSCYPPFKISVPRKVWKIKFNFPPGWYISDWFCAVRIVPVWSECKAVLSLVQPKRKCMLLYKYSYMLHIYITTYLHHLARMHQVYSNHIWIDICFTL